MTLIGDTKEEDREFFAMMKHITHEKRQERKSDAFNYFQKVRMLMDDGIMTVDPNGTWNWKLKGIAGQYWPSKGRWQYTDPKLIKVAKVRQAATKSKHYSYYTKHTQFGGGIHKFITWLERHQ